ncbi:MAG: hypothetical protein K5756_06845 [Clostridiales bacterium]|nr:hypothetical protein [Clostridiales bacterium]
MLFTCCSVFVLADDCDHSQYTYTWKTVIEPDCQTKTNGLEQKICDHCGAVLDEDTLPWEYSHDYSKYVILKEPTCTTKGAYKEHCSKCDQEASYTVLIPNTH